jgi:hypothetical protein
MGIDMEVDSVLATALHSTLSKSVSAIKRAQVLGRLSQDARLRSAEVRRRSSEMRRWLQAQQLERLARTTRPQRVEHSIRRFLIATEISANVVDTRQTSS